jgi:ATP adenylyltransferase
MSLEQLWAGWRASYVASVSEPGTLAEGRQAATGDRSDIDGVPCVFCRILASGASEEERRIVYAGPLTVALLNAYPYASGHLLVLPRRHVSGLSDLDEVESSALWETTRSAVEAIEEAYRPDGVNLGANLGRAAGAGIPSHLHLHALPRWIGDTNFMTSIAETRVLPEPLDVSWAKLHHAWPS